MKLILGPRPGKKSKDTIKAHGVTDIVTLLCPREQPFNLERLAKQIDAQWHHFPIDGGHIDTLSKVDLDQLFLAFDNVTATRDDAVIYAHCSAGIHRTGFVAYLLQRRRGLSPADARQQLSDLRPVTAEQVGDERLALAESMLQTWLAKKV